MPGQEGKPRIVIYGMGQFGQLIARLATEKDWPVVAAFNRAGPKIGQDVGRLAGLDRALAIAVAASLSTTAVQAAWSSS